MLSITWSVSQPAFNWLVMAWRQSSGMGRSVDTLSRALRTLRVAVDEVVRGTNTLETKPTGRDSLEAVMAKRISRKCSSYIWSFVLYLVSRRLKYGWYPEQMSVGKLSFKSLSTRWHIQAKKAMPEKICKKGIQTRKVKVEQLRPTEWRTIRQSFT